MRSFWSSFVCRGGLAAGVLLVAVATTIPSCTTGAAPGRIRPEALEISAEAPLNERIRAIVCDPDRVAPLLLSISDRIAYLEIRTDREWEALAAGCSDIGPRPDFSSGVFLAVVSRIGQPVDGAWPCRLESVRVQSGFGLVSASLHAGTYLPDGMACLEGVFVAGLRRVVMVDLNGERYFVR